MCKVEGFRWVLAAVAAAGLLGGGDVKVRAVAAAPVFGPVDLVRNSSAPAKRTWTFNAAPAGPDGYFLCVENGGRSRQFQRATAARITLNGVAVFVPQDFASAPAFLFRKVTLGNSNRLEAEVQSRAGTGLTLSIQPGATCAGQTPVNRPPSITSTPVAAATVLEEYRYQVAATDPDGDAVTFALTAMPPGMTIDPATGLVSWLPPGTGTFTVTVRATDAKGAPSTQSFPLTAGTSVNRPPHITPMPARRIPAGVPFSLEFSADDPDPGDTVTFLLQGGPAGAAIADGHALTWTPTFAQIGVHQVSIGARDAAGAADSAGFAIEVVASDGAPVLGALTDAVTTPATRFERTLSAVDPNPGDVLTFSLANGPAALTVGPDGHVSWTPAANQLGSHQVTVMVTDSTGLADAGVFTIAVGVPPLPQAPIARDDRYAVRQFRTLEEPPPGVLGNDEDPNGLPLAAQLVTPPARGSLTLDADGGFSYTPQPPPAGGTAPTLAFTHTYVSGRPLVVASVQPVVADLDGDGKAEIVYQGAEFFSNRRLVAVHGDTGATAWATDAYQPNGSPKIMLCLGSCELALADLDANGRPEIIAVHSDDESARLRNRLIAFNSDGSYRWSSDDILDGTVTQTTGMFVPTVADLDGDGLPEIIVGHNGKTVATPPGVISEDLVTVFEHDGHIRWTIRVPSTASSGRLTVADVDVDGTPEILIGGAIVNRNGTVRWNAKAPIPGVLDVAVANLDDDPFGEIVYVERFGNLYVYEHTGAKKWGPVKNPTFSAFSNVAIGDVDGDGLSEILMARDGVEVWSRAGVLLRVMPLPNGLLSYGGTPTIFDLNGDGRPEVIHVGARSPFDTGFVHGGLYIFDGPTGALLHMAQTSRNGGAENEGPVVADINGDGSAEIVTGGWDETKTLHVFKAAAGGWARTRPIWNEAAYHVTNVEPAGRIPAHEAINWLTPGLNSFRVNTPMPAERLDEHDRFTYIAHNGQLPSNLATVDIDILPPNSAPRILSDAPPSAAPGLEYLYAVRAVDPDIGDHLTFMLPVAPAGMTVDAGTGLVRWTPPVGASGPVTAVVKAMDQQNQSSLQSFVVTVAQPVTVPGLLNAPVADAPGALAAAGLALGSVTMAPSSAAPLNSVIGQEPLAGTLVPQGSLVNVVVSSGPAPVAVPYLVDLTESAAIARLDLAGFGHTVARAFSNATAAGQVTAQQPAAGTPLVPGSVALTVSAGPGLVVRLARHTTAAGAAISFTAAAYDLQFAEQAAPGLVYAIAPARQPVFGALPTVVGTAIVPGATTRGAFRITATDQATGRSASAEFAVTAPLTPGKASSNEVYARMSGAMADIDALAQQGRTALAAGNAAAITPLLQQMVQRWRQVDRTELRLATPFALAEGFFPTAADLPALGLTPTAADLLALDVLREADEDLRAWIAGLREPSTSMNTLDLLATRFGTRAARLHTLTLSEWGAIKARPIFTTLVADRIPELYSAITDDLAQALVNAGQPGPSTLAEQLTTTAMQWIVDKTADGLSETYRSAKQFTTDILIQAAWSAAIVSAAHRFKEFAQAQEITAVVSGASMSFHVFESEWAWIEADIDPESADSNVVITVGPDVLYAVIDAVNKMKELTKFGKILDPNAPKDDGRAKTEDDLFDGLKQLYKDLKGVDQSAHNVELQVKNAFQPSGLVMRGCVFSSSPACAQLVYEEGIRSVYHYAPPDEFSEYTGLPVPILFLVYNRTTGQVFIDTPVFLPTLPEQEPEP